MVNFMLCIFYYPEIFIEFHFFKKREKRKEEETQRGRGCDDEAEAGEMRLQAEALRERQQPPAAGTKAQDRWPRSLGTNLLHPHFDFWPPEACGNLLLLSPGKLTLRTLDQGHMAPLSWRLGVSKYKSSAWSTVGMSRPAPGSSRGFMR